MMEIKNLSYPKINPSLFAKATSQTVSKANHLIRRLQTIKKKDKEFFDLNGGSIDLLQLIQFLQQAKNETKARKQPRLSHLLCSVKSHESQPA